METVWCPVCETGEVVFDNKAKKGVCNNCESTLVAEGTEKYVLKKLGDKGYTDRYKELRKRQNEYIGLTIDEWERLRTGGLTDEEQKVHDKEKAQEEREQRLASMIVTTTPSIVDQPIQEYKGIVTGQVAAGVNVFKDIFSGIRNVVGGRSQALQETMKKMREEALRDLKEEAVDNGANAVVGVSLDFDEYAENMLLLTVTGTAVLV